MNSNKNEAPPRFELGISCLLDRRFNQLSHGALISIVVTKQIYFAITFKHACRKSFELKKESTSNEKFKSHVNTLDTFLSKTKDCMLFQLLKDSCSYFSAKNYCVKIKSCWHNQNRNA